MQSQVVMIFMTPDEVTSLVEAAVSRILNAPKDRAVSRKEAGQILGKSVNTITRMEQRGELTPIHDYGHPRYSYLQLIEHKGQLYRKNK